MAYIPIKVEDLRIGLSVKFECLKKDNPFSEKEFKIKSPITLAVLKEIPHVRLFFDPGLSDPEPTIVERLSGTMEQDTGSHQPITVPDSILPSTDFSSSPPFPTSQPSPASNCLVNQSRPILLKWEESPDIETHLSSQELPNTESISTVEAPPPEELQALEPAFLVLDYQEHVLEPTEDPQAPIAEEAVSSRESVECDCSKPLEVVLNPLPQGTLVSHDDHGEWETEEIPELPIPVTAFTPPETDHGNSSELLDAAQSLPQVMLVSQDNNWDLKTEEVADQLIPVKVFAPPETDHVAPLEPREGTLNPFDPTPQGEHIPEKGVEPEISHDQLLFPSDDLIPQQAKQRQREKPQVCQIQPSDLERAAYVYHHACWQTKMALTRMFEGQEIGLKITNRVLEDLEKALGNQETAGALIDLFGSMNADDPFFAHAFNVCMLSLLIGRELDLDHSECSALGLGALLHDIGTLSSPGPVGEGQYSGTHAKTRDGFQHCQRGKKQVKRFEGIPPASLDIIYHHHERLNGTGAPQGLKGKEIAFLAKIVMVADEYDHLCHQSDPSHNLSPSQALSHLYYQEIVAFNMKQSGGSDQWWLDGEPIPSGPPASWPDFHSTIPKVTESGLSGDIVIALIKALGVYPPGSIVELTNGTLGRVTGVNFEKRTKPPIMLCNPDLRQADATMFDLAEEDTLHIVKSIPIQHLPSNIREYLFAERMV